MKKTVKHDSFSKDGISLDETKMLMLMATYLLGFLVFLYIAYATEDIRSVKSILMTLITAIAGVNVINHGIDKIGIIEKAKTKETKGGEKAEV